MPRNYSTTRSPHRNRRPISQSSNSRSHQPQIRNISQDDTSSDDSPSNKKQVRKSSAQYSNRHQDHRNSNSNSYPRISNKDYSKQKKHNSLLDDSSSFDENTKQRHSKPYKQDFQQKRPREKSNNRSHNYELQRYSCQEQVMHRVKDILHEIQTINYQQRQFEDLRGEFSSCCKGFLVFSDYFPEPKNQIGQNLLKNGLFHEMWSKVLLKNPQIDKQSCLSVYYNRFNQKVKQNRTNFQQVYNPIPDSYQQCFNSNSTKASQDAFKKYLKTVSYSKQANVIKLYEEVKKEIQEEEKKNRHPQQQNSEFALLFQEWKLSIQQYHKNQNQKINQLFSCDIKGFNKSQGNIQGFSTQAEKQLKIREIKKLRTRSRSPLSQRFRLVHQYQTNQRRTQAQMACAFCGITQFYYLYELQIVKIQEAYFNQNHQLFVVKAYFVQYVPELGKMKLQPKLKNLLAAYKYTGLLQLVRLQKSYGKFDGIIVYPQCMNIKNYIGNKKCDELKLLKDDYLKQVRQQLQNQIIEDQSQKVKKAEQYQY